MLRGRKAPRSKAIVETWTNLGTQHDVSRVVRLRQGAEGRGAPALRARVHPRLCRIISARPDPRGQTRENGMRELRQGPSRSPQTQPIGRHAAPARAGPVDAGGARRGARRRASRAAARKF